MWTSRPVMALQLFMMQQDHIWAHAHDVASVLNEQEIIADSNSAHNLIHTLPPGASLDSLAAGPDSCRL